MTEPDAVAGMMRLVVDYARTREIGWSRDECNEAGDRVKAAITGLVRERDAARVVIDALHSVFRKDDMRRLAEALDAFAATAPPDGEPT